MCLRISKKKAKALVIENQETLAEQEQRLLLEPRVLTKNLIRSQIANRKTIIKALEKIIAT